MIVFWQEENIYKGQFVQWEQNLLKGIPQK